MSDQMAGIYLKLMVHLMMPYTFLYQPWSDLMRAQVVIFLIYWSLMVKVNCLSPAGGPPSHPAVELAPHRAEKGKVINHDAGYTNI